MRRSVTLRSELDPAALVILEGAQGALLDRDHGEHPWVTPSRISRRAAHDALTTLGLGDAPSTCWGVLRAYFTRHGAGPFPTEDQELTRALPEPHNTHGPWQGAMRVGWFDAVLARRAIEIAGPIDRLAITCLDRLDALPEVRLRTATGWQTSASGLPYLEHLEAALDRSIDLVSRGPAAGDKVARVRC